MPLQGQPRVVGGHPFPVVLHTHEALSAQLDRDGDATGAGIERVLDQFLDDGGGTLDDLTRGDLIGEVRRQAGDLAHAHGKRARAPATGRGPQGHLPFDVRLPGQSPTRTDRAACAAARRATATRYGDALT